MPHETRKFGVMMLEEPTIGAVLGLYDDVFDGTKPFEDLEAWEQEVLAAFNTSLAVGTVPEPALVV